MDLEYLLMAFGIHGRSNPCGSAADSLRISKIMAPRTVCDSRTFDGEWSQTGNTYSGSSMAHQHSDHIFSVIFIILATYFYQRHIAGWEGDVALFQAATNEVLNDENWMMIVMDMCPDVIRRHLKDGNGIFIIKRHFQLLHFVRIGV